MEFAGAQQDVAKEGLARQHDAFLLAGMGVGRQAGSGGHAHEAGDEVPVTPEQLLLGALGDGLPDAVTGKDGMQRRAVAG